MQYNIGVYDVKGLVNMGTVLFQLCSTILVYIMLKGWSTWAVLFQLCSTILVYMMLKGWSTWASLVSIMQYNIGVYHVKGLVNMGTVLFQLCSTILVYMMLKGWSPWAQSCFNYAVQYWCI